MLEHTYHWPFQEFIFTSSEKFLEDPTSQGIFLGVSNSMSGKIGKTLNVKSLTLRDTSKESQNPTVTKIYSVSFNYDTELLDKK